MAPTEHAEFSPSASARWLACPASHVLNPPQASSSQIEAAKGTLAHQVAEHILTHPDETIYAQSYVGRVVNDIILSQDLMDAVQFYVDEVRQTLNEASEEAELYVEEKVFINDYCWGTGDAIIYDPAYNEGKGVLHTYDLKTGRGDPIAALGNTQLMIYAYAFSKQIKPPAIPPFYQYIHIVQPRHPQVQPHQIWPAMWTEVAEWAEYTLLPTIDNILSSIKSGKELPFNPGNKQCRWCQVRGKCDALREYVFKEAEIEFKDYTETAIPQPEIGKLSSEERARLLNLIPMIEYWAKAVKQEILEGMLKGDSVEGYKIVESTKYRKFDLPEEKMAELLKSTGIDPYKKKLISPAQALKLLPKADPNREKVEAHIYKPQGSPVIAPASSKKPEYAEPTTAEDTFKKYAS